MCTWILSSGIFFLFSEHTLLHTSFISCFRKEESYREREKKHQLRKISTLTSSICVAAFAVSDSLGQLESASKLSHVCSHHTKKYACRRQMRSLLKLSSFLRAPPHSCALVLLKNHAQPMGELVSAERVLTGPL